MGAVFSILSRKRFGPPELRLFQEFSEEQKERRLKELAVKRYQTKLNERFKAWRQELINKAL